MVLGKVRQSYSSCEIHVIESRYITQPMMMPFGCELKFRSMPPLLRVLAPMSEISMKAGVRDDGLVVLACLGEPENWH